MDLSVFEDILTNADFDKIDTEKCLDTYFRKTGLNKFRAAELAQSNLINFVEQFNKSIESARKRNVPFLFSFASPEILKVDLTYFPIHLICKKLSSIDWREFEHLSGDILKICFGGLDVQVTRGNADGGVDFEGKIPIKSNACKHTYGFLEVYGQSKQYSGNVGIYDIKSFVAFANSKKRNYQHPPQVFFFFTTSDYATNAINELRENNFVGFSGIELATLLFNHKAAIVAHNPSLISLFTSQQFG